MTTLTVRNHLGVPIAVNLYPYGPYARPVEVGASWVHESSRPSTGIEITSEGYAYSTSITGTSQRAGCFTVTPNNVQRSASCIPGASFGTPYTSGGSCSLGSAYDYDASYSSTTHRPFSCGTGSANHRPSVATSCAPGGQAAPHELHLCTTTYRPDGSKMLDCKPVQFGTALSDPLYGTLPSNTFSRTTNGSPYRVFGSG